MQSRRDFIKNAAMVSGTLGLWGSLGAPIRKALAIEAQPGSSFLDAEHVVILMQENRSFDHCFGSLKGVRGFNDPRAIQLPNGHPVWAQTNAAGETFLPFRLNIKDTRATWMGCLPHSWQSQVDARNGGTFDRWLDAKTPGEKAFKDMPLTLGHYTRDDIPFYYELADAFTICDQHFCSSLTGTTPNRLHLWTGTIRAEQSPSAQANVSNEDADYGQWVSWKTFPERLEDHGVAWKIYQNEIGIDSGLTSEQESWLSNFGDNPIEYFSQFNVRFSKAYRDHLTHQIQSLPGTIEGLEKQLASPELPTVERTRLETQLKAHKAALAVAQTDRKTFNGENFAKLSPKEKSLHERALGTNAADPNYRELDQLTYKDGDIERKLPVPKGDVLHQFRKDVETGNLPAVSWLVAPERFSDHPSSAWYGAWYISETMNILTQNPEVWKKTIFILTYDENDGYFDHVPPFVSPDPRRPETGRVSKSIDASLEYVHLEQDQKRVPHDEARESPIGLGYRVPMIIASPWTRGGCVCSQVFDHTSVLQFLEKFVSHRTGNPVRETNINSWRRAVCGDLTSAFQPASKTDAPLHFPAQAQVVESIHRAKFKPLPVGFEKLDAKQLLLIREDITKSALMPRQEPGISRSSPLPYELYADGAMDAGGNIFKIRFEAGNNRFGERSAGCPFTVYAVVGEGKTTVRNYAVTAGDVIEDTWNIHDFLGGIYDLRVYGPNGFFRQFVGSGRQSVVEIKTSYAGASDSMLQIIISNRDEHRIFDVEVSDESYRSGRQAKSIGPGATAIISIDTQPSHQWYDLALTVAPLPDLKYRLSGRVENGQWTFTDPAMA